MRLMIASILLLALSLALPSWAQKINTANDWPLATSTANKRLVKRSRTSTGYLVAANDSLTEDLTSLTEVQKKKKRKKRRKSKRSKKRRRSKKKKSKKRSNNFAIGQLDDFEPTEEIYELLPEEEVTTTTRTSSKSSNSKSVQDIPAIESINQITTTEYDVLPQTKKVSSFALTPIVGATFFNLDGTFLTDNFVNDVQTDVGFTAGIAAEYSKPTSFLGFESGVFFSKLRIQGDDNNNFFCGSRVTCNELNYLENDYIHIPLNVKLYPIKREKFNLHAKLGATAGFLMNSTLDLQNLQFGGINQTNDVTNLFNVLDFLGNVGLGGKFNLSSSMSLMVEAVYMRSLTDISDTGLSDAYHEGFSATAGLSINL